MHASGTQSFVGYSELQTASCGLHCSNLYVCTCSKIKTKMDVCGTQGWKKLLRRIICSALNGSVKDQLFEKLGPNKIINVVTEG